MKDTEIFYFDVDGTLLDNTYHKIPKSTKTSLLQLKALGYKLALCTGRNLQGILEVEDLNFMDWDAYVLANGSLLLDKDKNIVEEIIFDPQLIHDLDSFIAGPLLLEGDENFITKKANNAMNEAFQHFGIEGYPVRQYNNEKVFNLICYSFDEITEPMLSTVLSMTQTAKDQLGNTEMMPATSGKHNGVLTMNAHLRLSKHVAFGDGENDVLFLQEAPISVAMGNGVQRAQDVATHTTSNVDEDGIFKALKHFGVL